MESGTVKMDGNPQEVAAGYRDSATKLKLVEKN